MRDKTETKNFENFENLANLQYGGHEPQQQDGVTGNDHTKSSVEKKSEGG